MQYVSNGQLLHRQPDLQVGLSVSLTQLFLFGGQVTAHPFASGDEREREVASDGIRMGAIAIARPIVFGWTAIASARKLPRAAGRFAIAQAFRDFADVLTIVSRNIES